MPHKQVAIQRAWRDDSHPRRPTMVAISGDSAAGKTTLTRGLVAALGPERITAICVDDYHRYDREERRSLPFTPLNPECNYVEIMEQHLQLLAIGQPILKPVYDHSTGTFTRPALVHPAEFVVVEGLLPLHTKLSRACFDVKVHLDPPESLRYRWKVQRDTAKRGYTREQVLADLSRREPESAAFIRPQRRYADIVVRFAPPEAHHGPFAEPTETGRPEPEGVDHTDLLDGPPPARLDATLLLRPTIPHPDLSGILADDNREAVHLKLIRDEDGKPVDALHIHDHASREVTRRVEEAIWANLGVAELVPPGLGQIEGEPRSEPLAMTQLLLLYQMLMSLHDR